MRDAGRVGARRALEESKEEPATLSHYHQPPGSNLLTGIIIGEQVPFTETLREFNVQSVFVFLRAVERYEHQYPRGRTG